MQLALIVNPAASSTTPRRRQQVEDALGRGNELEVHETTARDHAADLARAAAERGAEAIIVLAGDGTLNEAANGLIGTAAALAPLPGGSTNVFARTIGLPRTLPAATDTLLEALERRSWRRIGLGVGNGRRFLFHLGVGFDAAVIAVVERHVERHAALKRRLPHTTFAVTTATTFVRGYDRRRPSYRVELPGSEAEPGFYAIVSNTTPYAFFGPRPLVVTHGAGLHRPLALTTFRRLHTRDFATAGLRALRGGRGVETLAAVDQHEDLTKLRFQADAPFPWQVDGDYLGVTSELEIHYEPDALSVVVPASRPEE